MTDTLNPTNGLKSPWTDERVERLRALCAEHHTAGEIARVLGLNRNAVIGKAARLGLSGFSNGAPKKPRLVRRTRTASALNEDRRLTQTLRRIVTRAPVEPTESRDPLWRGHVDLLELQSGDCRYTADDVLPFFFCGAAVCGTVRQVQGQEVTSPSSYCIEHHQLCYGPRQATPEQIERAAKMRAAKQRNHHAATWRAA